MEPFHPDWLELEVDQSKAIRPEDCRDAEPFCRDWAASGETNPSWTISPMTAEQAACSPFRDVAHSNTAPVIHDGLTLMCFPKLPCLALAIRWHVNARHSRHWALSESQCLL